MRGPVYTIAVRALSSKEDHISEMFGPRVRLDIYQGARKAAKTVEEGGFGGHHWTYYATSC